jgi:hypothetical protein
MLGLLRLSVADEAQSQQREQPTECIGRLRAFAVL